MCEAIGWISRDAARHRIGMPGVGRRKADAALRLKKCDPWHRAVLVPTSCPVSEGLSWI